MKDHDFIKSERPLATIQTISVVNEHPNADRLEVARIKGWQTVIAKNSFRAGDRVIFIEVDAFVPCQVAPFLCEKQGPKLYNGVKGHRIKTLRLRGIISQGLILPISDYFGVSRHHVDGYDVTDQLGIQKYDPPVPAALMGEAAGLFPGWGRKTDQLRIQTCIFDIWENIRNDQWMIEEKADGTSMSCGIRDEEIVVCGRNVSFFFNEGKNPTNSIVNCARYHKIPERLIRWKEKTNRNIMISGELIGHGIQGNPYKLSSREWRVFDILDVDRREYLTIGERLNVLEEFNSLVNAPPIESIPILSVTHTFKEMIELERFRGKSYQMLSVVDNVLKMAEGKSVIGKSEPQREGLVFKSIETPDISFKAISNHSMNQQ